MRGRLEPVPFLRQKIADNIQELKRVGEMQPITPLERLESWLSVHDHLMFEGVSRELCVLEADRLSTYWEDEIRRLLKEIDDCREQLELRAKMKEIQLWVVK